MVSKELDEGTGEEHLCLISVLKFQGSKSAPGDEGVECVLHHVLHRHQQSPQLRHLVGVRARRLGPQLARSWWSRIKVE